MLLFFFPFLLQALHVNALPVLDMCKQWIYFSHCVPKICHLELLLNSVSLLSFNFHGYIDVVIVAEAEGGGGTHALPLLNFLLLPICLFFCCLNFGR